MHRKKDIGKRALMIILAAMLAAPTAAVQQYTAYAAEAEENSQEEAGEETAETENAEAEDTESAEAETAEADAEGAEAAPEETAEGATDAAAPAEEPADIAEGEVAEEGTGTEKPEGGAAGSLADELINQRMQIADDDIMQIRIGYQFDDGSFDEWARGTAFVVGSRYLLTRQSLINTKTESGLYKKILKEKDELYKRIGVSLSDEVTTEKHIKFYVEDRDGHTLPVSDTSIKSGMGLVVLKNALENVPPIVFADPNKTGFAEGMQVNLKAAGNMNGRCDVVTLSGTVVANEDKSASFSFTVDSTGSNIDGAPLYNDDGHVIGMVSAGGDVMTGYTINALETFLSTNGVQYRSIEQIEKELAEIERQAKEAEMAENGEGKIDFSDLEAAIKAAESIEDLSGYTEETAEPFSAALEEAKKVMANEEATQEEIDAAAKSLKTAQGALEEKKSILESLPIVPIAAAIAAIIVAVTVILVIKKKKDDDDDDDDEYEEKPKKQEKKSQKRSGGRKEEKRSTSSSSRSYMNDDDYSDSSSYKGEYVNDDGLDITHRSARRGRRVTEEDASPSLSYADYYDDPDGKVSVLDEDGSSDTTLLSKKTYLIRKDNGKRIPIVKDKFVIGKERKKVDYCIGGNPTVSRTHCRLRLINDQFYIEDLDSSNFTYVDGNQIPANKPVLLEDGATIKLSNVEFEFHN